MEKASTLSPFQKEALFHLKIDSKLLIQCRVVCCPTHGYYDLLVSKNPEILTVAMEDNVITQFTF